jgi:hypothetical protein
MYPVQQWTASRFQSWFNAPSASLRCARRLTAQNSQRQDEPAESPTRNSVQQRIVDILKEMEAKHPAATTSDSIPTTIVNPENDRALDSTGRATTWAVESRWRYSGSTRNGD